MEDKQHFVIASRCSPLALAQTHYIIDLLKQHPVTQQHTFEILEVKTSLGDVNQSSPLFQMSQTGLFTKSVQVPLLEKKARFAVHSLKDLPTYPTEGLTGMAQKRGDMIVCSKEIQQKLKENQTLLQSNEEKKHSIKLGSSSLRRQAMLKSYFGAECENIRGNIQTRLSKMPSQVDAVVLACAGLERMGMEQEGVVLEESQYLYAPGQGVLGVECRQDDTMCVKVLQVIEENMSKIRCVQERIFLNKLEGGCKLPIGVYSEIQNEEMKLIGQVWNIEGNRTVREEVRGSLDDLLLGEKLAKAMLEKGAREILTEVRQAI